MLHHMVELPDVLDVHNPHVFEQNFFNTVSLQNRSGNLSQHSDFSKFWLEILHVAHSHLSQCVKPQPASMHGSGVDPVRKRIICCKEYHMMRYNLSDIVNTNIPTITIVAFIDFLNV